VLQTGDEVDFTSYIPGGIRSFTLSSSATTESLFQQGGPNFVHGIRFTNEGIGDLWINEVPEPSTLLLLGISAISLLGYRKANTLLLMPLPNGQVLPRSLESAVPRTCPGKV
jgi:hypothetical protein